MKYNELWFEEAIELENNVDEVLQMQDEVKVAMSSVLADFFRQDGYTVERAEDGLYTISLV